MLVGIGKSAKIGNGSFDPAGSDLLEGHYEAFIMAAGSPRLIDRDHRRAPTFDLAPTAAM
jgi:hypothetical protein